eukprot:TRINITY_DN1341_c0_g3_i4.p4 TRINITY_DN1341_c0_g3~~TRINITY_DN1341_c0_g3_i4.p4  ORF type:complete len:104 (-),score=4.15 TRINITY_DN1341_c0_g3_i4:561-872(-)
MIVMQYKCDKNMFHVSIVQKEACGRKFCRQQDHPIFLRTAFQQLALEKYQTIETKPKLHTTLNIANSNPDCCVFLCKHPPLPRPPAPVEKINHSPNSKKLKNS